MFSMVPQFLISSMDKQVSLLGLQVKERLGDGKTTHG